METCISDFFCFYNSNQRRNVKKITGLLKRKPITRGIRMSENTKKKAVVQDDVVVADKFQLSDLLHKEDWLAIWGAFILMLIASVGVITGAYKFKGVTFGKWGGDKGSILKFF